MLAGAVHLDHDSAVGVTCSRPPFAVTDPSYMYTLKTIQYLCSRSKQSPGTQKSSALSIKQPPNENESRVGLPTSFWTDVSP